MDFLSAMKKTDERVAAEEKEAMDNIEIDFDKQDKNTIKSALSAEELEKLDNQDSAEKSNLPVEELE